MKPSDDLHPDDQPLERAPRLNPVLLGHDEAEAALLAAWNSGRMPHAWLLTGPRGIGKATLAFRFARFVLAGGGGAGGLFGGARSSLDVDQDGAVFQRVAALGHSDLRLIRRGLNRRTGKWRQEIVVEDVRDMGGFLRLTAGEGGWRIVIVDSADEMNRAAANAALKVVEEPPDNALILLISHTPGRLLPTIRSRCRRLALRPLDDSLLKRIVVQHLPQLQPAELDRLAALAEGSAGKALSLADHGGVELHEAMLGLLTALPRLDGVALERISDKLGRAGAEDGFRVFGEMLTGFLGRLCRDLRAGNGESTPAKDPEAAVGRVLGVAAGLDRWLEVWEKLNELFARAESAKLDRKQVVVDAVLTLAQAARGRS